VHEMYRCRLLAIPHPSGAVDAASAGPTCVARRERRSLRMQGLPDHPQTVRASRGGSTTPVDEHNQAVLRRPAMAW